MKFGFLPLGSMEHRLSTLTPRRSIHPIGLIEKTSLPLGSVLEAEEGSGGGAETQSGLSRGAASIGERLDDANLAILVQ